MVSATHLDLKKSHVDVLIEIIISILVYYLFQNQTTDCIICWKKTPTKEIIISILFNDVWCIFLNQMFIASTIEKKEHALLTKLFQKWLRMSYKIKHKFDNHY